MKPKLTLKSAKIAKALTQRQRDLAKVPQRAHKEFVKNTPVRSGNARRRTRLKGDTIKASYPYATRLDDGYSSQARNGMTEPTVKYIQKIVKKIMGK